METKKKKKLSGSTTDLNQTKKNSALRKSPQSYKVKIKTLKSKTGRTCDQKFLLRDQLHECLTDQSAT